MKLESSGGDIDSRIFSLSPSKTDALLLGRDTTQAPLISELDKSIRNQIFISYSHRDVEWLEKLQKYLKPAIRNKTVNIWDDTKIQPGKRWHEEINAALSAAKVAVLLVSVDFLNSDFINENELPPLLEAAKSKELTIIWILISECMYEETEVKHYQAAHSLSRPLVSLNAAEEATTLKEICKAIKNAANQ